VRTSLSNDTELSTADISSLLERTASRPPLARPSDIETGIGSILRALGEDAQREGLRETPRRYEKAMRFLTSGNQVDLRALVGNALFEEAADGMVVVRDIELYSLCEHHLLPFFGRAHVAYLPAGKVIGLSKIPRIIDAFARRLQVQERLTAQVAQALMDILKPRGVAVVMEASHFCMMMRGVEKQNSLTVTSSMLGAFKDDASVRRELLDLLNRPAGR
jgi:GTP cyclohydrolase IA